MLLEAIGRHGLPAVIFACCHQFQPVGYDDAMQQVVRTRVGSDNIRAQIKHWYSHVFANMTRKMMGGKLMGWGVPSATKRSKPEGVKPRAVKPRAVAQRTKPKRAKGAGTGAPRPSLRESKGLMPKPKRPKGAGTGAPRPSLRENGKVLMPKPGSWFAHGKRTINLVPGELPKCTPKLRERGFMCRGASASQTKARWVDATGNAVG